MGAKTLDVYIEKGTKRAFACAVDWPGWSRSGKNEDEALAALRETAPRYAKVTSKLGFVAPTSFRVVQRVAGDSTTDFGAPGAKTTHDETPVTDRDLERLVAHLEAAWSAFDAGVRKARGKTLRAGPRGGGRSLDKMVAHVRDAELMYLSGLGAAARGVKSSDTKRVRALIREGLASSARGEIAPKGPRGGLRWKPRYFVRRDVWHMLDHLWEIEDRTS